MEAYSVNELGIPKGSVPLGTIVAFALSAANVPSGWLLCNGSPIPSQYQELITALASENTPNLSGGIALVGAGTDGSGFAFDLYATGGERLHVLDTDEMPTHSHSVNGGDFGLHARSFIGEDDNDLPFETEASTNLGGTDPAGLSKPHNNMPPYYVINYIIYAGS
jgi:microcystin-dependent protein